MSDTNKHNEAIADKLARKTIKEFASGFDDLSGIQKYLKDGSIVTGERTESDRVIMYESDLLAHPEELDNILYGTLSDSDLIDNNTLAYLQSASMIESPDNVSQFVDFDPSQLSINSDLADEVFDREITELLPSLTNRQQEILDFFDEFDRLVGNIPTFTQPDDLGNVEFIDDGGWSDISTNPNDPAASITRIDGTAVYPNDNGKTLQSLRDTLDYYLEDVDVESTELVVDTRPDYEDKSSGFLKFRGLNQSILIKQEEGRELKMIEQVEDPIGSGIMKPKYLVDGFTITMWVRFKDVVNGGTLFNFGNPTRTVNPHGFRLETFILEKNGEIQPPDSFVFEDGTAPFSESNQERFVRLVVYEPTDGIKDSHVGLQSNDRISGIAIDSTLYNCTRIPIDMDEWYFIVATFNPDITENISADGSSYLNNPHYWRWNYRGVTYAENTQYGAKCKVEIISKSELLRARGYKT